MLFYKCSKEQEKKRKVLTMKATIKDYKDMTNLEKAKAIYGAMHKEYSLDPRLNPIRFQMLLRRLYTSYSNGDILTVQEWVKSYKDKGVDDLFDFARICKESKNLDLDNCFIRVSIYYDGYKTSNGITNLISKSESIQWIKTALDCHDPRLQNIDKYMLSF